MSRRTSLVLAVSSLLLSILVAPGAMACVREALQPAHASLDVRPSLPMGELSAQR